MPKTIVEWIVLVMMVFTGVLSIAASIGIVWLIYYLVTSLAVADALGY